MSIMPAVEPEQGFLFQIQPFEVTKATIGLRGAGSIAVDQSIVDAVEAAEKDELLALTVFVSRRGITITDDEVCWNLHVADVTLAE
jgi:hypothetical protein